MAGTTALTPPKILEGKIRKLFEQLGTAVEVEEEQLPYFQSITAMMGPFYQHCQFLQQWIYEKIRDNKKPSPKEDGSTNEQTLQKSELQRYLVGFFDTLLSDARNSGDTWEELMNAQTKGGLNEQAMQLMNETKDVTHSTLDKTLDRITNSGRK